MTGNQADDPIRVWTANASGWTTVVRGQQIESRRVASDAAIVEAVRARKPRRVLDLGWGEGWLVCVLTKHGIEVIGADGTAPLVQDAITEGGGVFYQASYDEMTNKPDRFGAGFDAVIMNFSLLDQNSSPLLIALKSILSRGGALFVQTVHPWTVRGDTPYALPVQKSEQHDAVPF